MGEHGVSGSDRSDRCFMAHALRLGARTQGMTAENPAVGCVIVAERHGRPAIAARGWTGQGGRPHAERVALDRAGDAARGATAYVTLEPCAHHGRTAPCAEALVAAGLKRVVTAMEDPDPRVSGRGHALLREAGIAVETGVMAEEAAVAHAGFTSRILRGRPHVLLKLAVSADSRIAAREGEQTTITGAAAGARAHLMRARADAIMIGRRTAAIDDPMLTCRLPGLEDASPVRVVLASDAELDPESRLVRSAREVPLWVAAAADAPAEAIDRLQDAGVEVVIAPRDAMGGLALPAVLAELAHRGVSRLMVEGGAALAGALVWHGLVDEVALFTAPVTLGGGGVAAPIGAAPDGFDPVEQEAYGEDRLAIYRRKAQCSPAS